MVKKKANEIVEPKKYWNDTNVKKTHMKEGKTWNEVRRYRKSLKEAIDWISMKFDK